MAKVEMRMVDSVTSIDDDVESDLKKVDGPERAEWGGKIEFILTCVGFAVGLGTVWRFPYLVYKNGGGAFLIPYTIMMALVGLPLFYLELYMGQFSSLGPLAVYKLSPFFKGLGCTSVMVTLLISIYYNVVIAICFFFLFKSMASELPWANCENAWNTINCLTLDQMNKILDLSNSINGTNSSAPIAMDLSGNFTANSTFEGELRAIGVNTKTPSEEFFYNHVLQLTEGMGVPGNMRWELVGCLALSWTIVCTVLIRGISSLGKVVYFTALFPYVLLSILLVRGAMLEGSMDGVIYYLRPQWSKLLEPQVWTDAAIQCFYALSVAAGGIIAMSSYNKFNNNIMRDSLIVVITTLVTSLWAGFVIFSVLGYMAKIKNVEVADVAAQGPGLTFVVYPEALSTMPLPPLWSVLFFFMMIILGFSSEFSLMETCLTAMLDTFPQYLRSSRKREIIFRICSCFTCFLCGLPMVTQGGFYLLNLVDNCAGGYPLIIVGVGELVIVTWIYGYHRFAEDIQMMVGKKPSIYFHITLRFISPVLMTVVLGFAIYQFKPLEFNGYVYPPRFTAVMWLIIITTIGFLPVFGLVIFCKNGGFTILKKVTAPESSWGPANACDRIGTRYEQKSCRSSSDGASGSSDCGRQTSQMSLPNYEEASKL